MGYGTYNGFGYANEPQWGLFNPAQSLFLSDPTLYNSLYATNSDAEGGKDPALRRNYNKYNPGLPQQVGPRNAWKRNFGGFGQEEEKSPVLPIAIIVVVIILYAMTSI